MDIISLIQLKKENIASKANTKELVFYQYLKGDVNYFDPSGLGDIEAYCVKVFTNNSENLDNETLRLRNSSPIKGFHYSYELISLCAVALSSNDMDVEALKVFCKSNGLKEKYVISFLFPQQFSLKQESEENSTTLETLIKEVFILENKVANQSLIYKSISEVENLVDVFIIENIIIELMKFHPDAEIRKTNEIFKQELIKLYSVTKGKISFLINTFVTTMIFFAVGIICCIAYYHWDAFEKFTWIIPLVLAALAFVYFMFLHKTIDSHAMIIRAKIYLTKSFLKFIGIEYSKIEDKLQDEL